MRPDIKSTQLGGVANLALLASVKSGFIPGADTFTYDRRLEALFKTLSAIRAGLRESQQHASPFPDAVGRWGLLHSFRYALVPPRIVWPGDPFGAREPGASAWRLYLNVAFDGGWEPYMRVIYRDLGYLLDTIFCNCDGYPLSTQGTFDAYCRWVRAHEVPSGIFYAESAASVLDHRYTEEAEHRLRMEPDAARAQRAVAGLALPQPDDIATALARLQAASPAARQEIVGNQLRALKGLFDLRAFYAVNEQGDDRRLLQFAQKAMPEFAHFLRLSQGLDALKPYRELIDWLLSPLPAEPQPVPHPPPPPPAPPTPPAPGHVQPGLIEGYGGATHGCLLLLHVTDAAKARRWIGDLPEQTRRRAEAAPGRLHWNIAFSAGGLRALGQPAEAVDRFPQEFIEGMEARAGLLGDVRGNHPEHWRRPRRHGPGPRAEVDLGSVHVVVQWRLVAPGEAGAGMHPFLQERIDALVERDSGLLLLAAEPMRSYPDAAGAVTEHFGFRDGLSQPKPEFGPPAAAPAEAASRASAHAAPAANTAQAGPDAPPSPPAPARFSDAVNGGEIFLGHPGDRDGRRFPDSPNRLMDNGSFLVIRKLRQHVDRWQAVLDAAAQRADPHHPARPAAEQAAARDRLAAMMMGRRHDGAPTLDSARGPVNDYDYAADPQGTRCPLQSHARRANPRLPAATPARKMPRLLRRGMSYGPRFGPGAAADPGIERGLYFMAYCGSLAEQFEIVQRWMAGGNSTGLHASHSDPMLGVPQPGVPRTFQWLGSDGQVNRIDLGEQPITELQWGLYLFAPSLEGLQVLAAGPAPDSDGARAPAAAGRAPDMHDPGEPYDPGGRAFERRKLLLQGRLDDKDSFWQLVRRQGGEMQTAYGRLEARRDEVLKVLRDGGTTHSVCGYGRRFAETLGEGFLGLDDPRHRELAVDTGIKAAIAAIDEERAFRESLEVAQARIAEIADSLAAAGQPPTIDILRLCDDVVARLCTRWWGLPDGRHMVTGGTGTLVRDDAEKAMCPRDFVFVARNNFGAHPSPEERRRGTTRGHAVLHAVAEWVKATPPGQFPELSAKIHEKLHAKPGGEQLVPWTIAGTMLGFGPSTLAHFALVMREWVEPTGIGGLSGPSLWDLQARLLAEGEARGTHAAAVRVLRGPLVAQMRREPVPGIVWRETPGTVCPHRAPEPPKTALGLHALMDDNDAEVLMFGGELDEKSPLFGVHACPGRGMAIGVLLGLVVALVGDGTVQRTPSPTLLRLVRAPDR